MLIFMNINDDWWNIIEYNSGTTKNYPPVSSAKRTAGKSQTQRSTDVFKPRLMTGFSCHPQYMVQYMFPSFMGKWTCRGGSFFFVFHPQTPEAPEAPADAWRSFRGTSGALSDLDTRTCQLRATPEDRLPSKFEVAVSWNHWDKSPGQNYIVILCVYIYICICGVCMYIYIRIHCISIT